mgnify:CR=1 FL=1
MKIWLLIILRYGVYFALVPQHHLWLGRSTRFCVYSSTVRYLDNNNSKAENGVITMLHICYVWCGLNKYPLDFFVSCLLICFGHTINGLVLTLQFTEQKLQEDNMRLRDQCQQMSQRLERQDSPDGPSSSRRMDQVRLLIWICLLFISNQWVRWWFIDH